MKLSRLLFAVIFICLCAVTSWVYAAKGRVLCKACFLPGRSYCGAENRYGFTSCTDTTTIGVAADGADRFSAFRCEYFHR